MSHFSTNSSVPYVSRQMAGEGLSMGTERWLIKGFLFNDEGAPGESGLQWLSNKRPVHAPVTGRGGQVSALLFQKPLGSCETRSPCKPRCPWERKQKLWTDPSVTCTSSFVLCCIFDRLEIRQIKKLGVCKGRVLPLTKKQRWLQNQPARLRGQTDCGEHLARCAGGTGWHFGDCPHSGRTVRQITSLMASQVRPPGVQLSR